MGNNNAAYELRKLRSEIANCYVCFDIRIANKKHPVTIQDLDFWEKKLTSVIGMLED